MKKVILTALLALFMLPFGSTAYAQEEPGALINRIKRDTAYLYGEATTSIRQEALVLAKELLCRSIEEWYKEQGREETRAVIARDIVTGCEEITLMRGPMHRAFAYVKKSDLTATDSRTTLARKAPEPSVAPAPAADKVMTDPAAGTADATGSETGAGTETKTETEAGTETKTGTVSPSFPLDELCALRSIEAVRNLLDRSDCKAVSSYGSVGRETRPADVERALLIIYSPVNGEVKSILDRKDAASKRRNLLTGREDSNRNYPGCGALWLIIKE